LEKVARSERLKLGNAAENESLSKLAKQMGLKSAAELVAAVGYGEFSPSNILNRVRGELAPENRTSDSTETLSGAATTLLQRRPKVDEEPEGSAQGELAFATNQEIELDPNAESGLSHNLARCCAPIPGDEVKGYITRGRGISVHQSTCANLRHYQEREPDRIVRAHWAGAAEKPYQALIALESTDRAGLLADVTVLIAARKININAVNTYPLKHGRARLNLAVTIACKTELDDLMDALRGVTGVVDVHRV
jgi:GTP pyrophosphokinase